MAQTAVDHKAQWETVNRVVYPVKDTDLTLPLYAVNWHPSHFDANVFDERDSMMSVAPTVRTGARAESWKFTRAATMEVM